MAVVVGSTLQAADRMENAIDFRAAAIFTFQPCRLSTHAVQRFELLAAFFTLIVVKRHLFGDPAIW